MNSLIYHAGKFINDSDLNSSEAAQAHNEWELSKIPTQMLKDELASREPLDTSHYGHIVDIISYPNWCSDCQKEFHADF